MTEHDAPVDAVLAVDIAPTQFGVALVSPRGLLIDRAAAIVPPADGPESLFATLVELIEEMLAEAAARHHVHVHVRGVGVACAGPVERDLENVSPLGLSWQRYPLRSRLVELTGLPVFGDLDARGLALAEGWRGAAQGHPNFCSITISNTIGGGVVLDNELLDGATGAGGSIGHVIVEPGGRRCRCGAQGCLEAEASTLAVEAITGRPHSEPTYEIMQRTGHLVGRAAAMTCNSLDLSLVVVGGTLAVDFAATFFHSAQLSLDEHARLPYSRGARITPSRLSESGPLLAAGAIGWRGVRRASRQSSRENGAHSQRSILTPTDQPPSAR
ncbi:MAG: ROK family protein [Acidimicrobiia bacterium]|nr:ROK family protein [Acidimicrobiia bacterium]